MHAETLSYLFHNLPAGLKMGSLPYTGPLSPPPAVEYRDVPQGMATLGQPRDGDFGWDNEFDEVRIDVPAFSIMRNKVTNGDFLRFVSQGGPVPHFWQRHDGGWQLRTMFGEIPLPLSWPVYVTQAQASTYAEWVGKKLPSEAEYYRMRMELPRATNGPIRGAMSRRMNRAETSISPVGPSARRCACLRRQRVRSVSVDGKWLGVDQRPLPPVAGIPEVRVLPGYSSPSSITIISC